MKRAAPGVMGLRPGACLKSVFRKVEGNGHDSVEIPVFTGMTVFRGVLQIDGVKSGEIPG